MRTPPQAHRCRAGGDVTCANSPSSPASAVESSAVSFSDGEPSAPSKSTHIVNGYSCSARMMESWSRSPSGPMSEPSMLERGEGTLTLCQAVSLASPGAKPATKWGSPTFATSGPTPCGSLARWTPPRVLLENVPGILDFDYFGEILGALSDMGRRVRWGVVGAADAGAEHTRERVWILADNESVHLEEQALADQARQAGQPRGAAIADAAALRASRWAVHQPGMVRAPDDDSAWVGRSKAIGNAQVPSCMALAYQILSANHP
jgi:hypothetical protein